MSKIGDVARRLTSSVVREANVANGPGRPPVHEEDWTKVTVVLLNRQIVSLDLLAADIRATNGAAIKRAEIIRALIDAFTESGLNLTSATTEGEMKETLLAHLRKENHHE